MPSPPTTGRRARPAAGKRTRPSAVLLDAWTCDRGGSGIDDLAQERAAVHEVRICRSVRSPMMRPAVDGDAFLRLDAELRVPAPIFSASAIPDGW